MTLKARIDAIERRLDVLEARRLELPAADVFAADALPEWSNDHCWEVNPEATGALARTCCGRRKGHEGEHASYSFDSQGCRIPVPVQRWPGKPRPTDP